MSCLSLVHELFPQKISNSSSVAVAIPVDLVRGRCHSSRSCPIARRGPASGHLLRRAKINIKIKVSKSISKSKYHNQYPLLSPVLLGGHQGRTHRSLAMPQSKKTPVPLKHLRPCSQHSLIGLEAGGSLLVLPRLVCRAIGQCISDMHVYVCSRGI